MMGGKKFTKRVEDFTCEVCGTKVKGTAFTDHCPQYLAGKHVDIFPDDKKSRLRRPDGAGGSAAAKRKMAHFLPLPKMRLGKI